MGEGGDKGRFGSRRTWHRRVGRADKVKVVDEAVLDGAVRHQHHPPLRGAARRGTTAGASAQHGATTSEGDGFWAASGVGACLQSLAHSAREVVGSSDRLRCRGDRR